MVRKGGDWMQDAPEAQQPAPRPTRPVGVLVRNDDEYAPDVEAIKDFAHAPKTTPLIEAMKALESGKAEIAEAWLYCGRWDKFGRRMEAERGERGYRLLHVRGHKAYCEAIKVSKAAFDRLRRREAYRAKKRSKKREGLYDFESYTDAGSLMRPDPNQFTEFTPLFNGPFNRQQYWDFFKGIARAFEEWNHNPIAKRIVNIMCQYALGRGFSIDCKNDKLEDEWGDYCKEVRLQQKLRKFWCREYLVNGELLIDHEECVSVDSSTIWDIVSDIENPDDILYYQQMFQTYTQTYAGIAVPGVPGSKQSEYARYIIRQIPADRIIFMRNECFSNEKRGRSILFSVLGWCKRIKDLYNAQVIGEQARASFIFDDTIKGSEGDVSAHAARYAYMPPPGSVFAHNEAIERKPMAPMQGVSPSKDGVGQEILAIIATAVGIPKEHLNILTTGAGSRATAIVGSEPFTKVIEDLQEDIQDLLMQLIERWCERNGFEFEEDDWQITFPSVAKDSTADVIKNYIVAKESGAINERRMAGLIAAELDLKDHDFDTEVKQGKDDQAKGLSLVPEFALPATLGAPSASDLAGALPDSGKKNDTKGKDKAKVIKQHKQL